MFDLIVRGKINKQIATELGTTERTVKAHRHEVMEKMQVHSLAELVSSRGTARSARSPRQFGVASRHWSHELGFPFVTILYKRTI